MSGKLKVVWAGEDPRRYTKQELGNKALGLMLLYNLQQHSDFEVPDFFVIPTTFFRAYMQKHGLEEKIRAIERGKDYSYCPLFAPHGIQELFYDFAREFSMQLQPHFENLSNLKVAVSELRVLWAQTEPEGASGVAKEAVALDDSFVSQLKAISSKLHDLVYRSSSPMEDAEFLFPGVFTSVRVPTCLHSSPVDTEALANVLSSLWSPYAEFYIARHGLQSLKREMAVVVQRFVKPKYAGTIYYYGGEIQVKMRAPHQLLSNNLLNPHIEFKQSTPISDTERSLVVDMLREVAAKLQVELSGSSRYANGFCLEFVVDDLNKTHLVQLRGVPPPQYLEQAERVSEYLPRIPSSRLICETEYEAIPFVVGEVTGPAINLIDFDFSGDWQTRLNELDRRYSGGIYILSPRRPLINLSIEESDALFHMLTPNKRGIIAWVDCLGWHHLDCVLGEEGVVVIQITDPKQTSPIRLIKTGEVISIYSNGRRAVVYRS
ncbi:PEP/pyruvate-binding domain-containing protein [Candidatus Woesearchaeota archaeon]|nr:PEP/pyruvate-binding domain-containing protein [Candidatus Woesearchaeota archaeon]